MAVATSIAIAAGIGGVTKMVDAQMTKNNAKAELLYSEIDRNSLFSGSTKKEDRSNMNATFLLNNADLEGKFNAMCQEKGINGLKGHRSVGGYRASMYNALPLASVQVLVDIMNELERQG